MDFQLNAALSQIKVLEARLAAKEKENDTLRALIKKITTEKTTEQPATHKPLPRWK